MIYIGSDHAGFALKEEVKKFLSDKGLEFEDLGADSEESVDYPDLGYKVAKKVAETDERGILICGSGIGMSIVANKVKDIRAALCADERFAELSRKHNDANVLVLAGRLTEVNKALQIVDVWLNTEYEGKDDAGCRHNRRLEKIEKYESD